MKAKKQLITLIGPTASGKTSLSLEVAEHFQCEIVSADSRQVYRELNIGVAKPTKEELQRAPHHMIDVVSIHEAYSAGRYAEEARNTIDRLFQTNDRVVMVGGSGLYINAVIEGMDELPGDLNIREELRAWCDSDGLESLQEELKRLDPSYYETVDISNPHRVMRAIEVIRITGRPFSELRTGKKTELPFDVVKIGLTGQREVLYDRINRRVDQMVEQGLEAEAREFLPLKHLTALQTVGYSEWFEAFEGKCTSEEAIEKIKQHTRQYAKRQLTWWRRDPSIQWAAIDQGGKLLGFVNAMCNAV
jgi:tRNA dimethylallyltransferase